MFERRALSAALSRRRPYNWKSVSCGEGIGDRHICYGIKNFGAVCSRSQSKMMRKAQI